MAKQQVLLVEREAKTRRLLKVSLEQAGYAVETARDGLDALAKLELHAPQLVLAATTLPKLDGYGLVRRMKENAEWARLPVVFMVDSDSIEDKVRGLELGVEDYLKKPVFVKELVSRVGVLLAKQVSLHLSESVADTRVAGDLSDLPTVDLLESLEQGGQSGVVRIRWNDRVGEVIFEDGEIVDARLRRLRGEEVVYRLLCLTAGSFEVTIGEIEAERIIESGTRALIEAGMRHAAEYNRLLEGLPGQDEVVIVDRDALEERLGGVPDDLDGILALLDGRRTVFDVIDDSPFDDISTLQTLARLQSEALLMIPAAEPSAIPGPPRTPTPPDEDVDQRQTEVFEPMDLDDDVPTLRPPAVAERGTGERVAHVVGGGEAEPVTLDLEGLDSRMGDLSPHTPPRGTQAAAVADEDQEEEAPITPRHGGDVDPGLGDERKATPTSPAGGKSKKSSSPPKSVPPATEDVDAAFQAVLSEIPSEYPAPMPAAEDNLYDLEEVGEVVPPTGSRVGPLPEAPPDDRADEPDEDEAHAEEPAPAEPMEQEPPPAEDELDDELDDDVEPHEVAAAIAEHPASLDLEDEEDHVPDAATEAALGSTMISTPASEEEAVEPLRDSTVGIEEAADEAPAEAEKASSTPAPSKPTSSKPTSSKPTSSKPSKKPISSKPSSSRPGRRKTSDSPPSSGLGRSGISEGFFARPHVDEDEVPPESEEEPVYLTDEQITRRGRGKVFLFGFLAIMGAVIVFAAMRGKGDGTGPSGPAPTAPASTASAPTTPTATATASATGAPSAKPAGDGGAAAQGGAGGAEDGKGGAGGAGGAEDGKGGAGGAESDDKGEGGALPEVDDPLKEAQKLIGSGQYKKGIPFAIAATKKDPSNGDAWFWLATGYESIGKMDDAREAYGKCAENKASAQFLGYCKGRAPKKK